MSAAVIDRLLRCADATEQWATLDREDCVLLLALWASARLTVRDWAPDVKRDAEVSPALISLRKAVTDILASPEGKT